MTGFRTDRSAAKIGKTMSDDMIRVECECGKRAKVPGRFAGRQVKCGGCGAALRIPDPSAEEDEEEEEDHEEEDHEDEDRAGRADDDDDDEGPRAKAPRRKSRTGGPKGVGSRVGKPKGPGSRVGKRKGPGSRVSKGAGSRTGRVGSGGAPRRRSRDEDEDPYAPSRAVLKDGPTGRGKRGKGRGGLSKKRQLGTEGHIFAIGIWHAAGGVLYALLGLALVFFSGTLGKALGPAAGVAALVGIVFVVLGGGSVAIGIGLTKLQGWARIAYAVVQGILILLSLPGMAEGAGNAVGNLVGIAYTVAILATLFGDNGSRVFSGGYLEAIRGDRRSIPFTSSPFFWIPLVLLGLAVLGFCALFSIAAGR